MPPAEDPADEDDGREPAATQPGPSLEVAPVVMEPLVVSGDGPERPGPVEDEGIEEVDIERDVIGTGLYRERTVVEEVVEEAEVRRPKRLTKEELRDERELRKLEHSLRRELAHRDSRLRGTLVYKTFYDMVCNRVGVIVAGFGIAMTLFTVFYDVLQGKPMSFGTRHLVALAVSLVVYFTGMGLEGLRIWSWECDGVEEAPEVDTEVQKDRRGQEAEDAHIPMIPQEAADEILNGNGGEDGSGGAT